MSTDNKFSWHSFNINKQLKGGWDEEIITYARSNAIHKKLSTNSVTSRESTDVKYISTLTVNGQQIKEDLPWLFELYEGYFYELGSSCIDEKLFVAKNEIYAVNCNVQTLGMRYECHIDSNPLQGLLFVTSHPEGEGGELIVSNRADSLGVTEINQDCEIIFPNKGELLFFNANHNPHYVSSLIETEENAIRVTVAMNYYTESNPESNRPTDLNNHLFLQQD